MPVSVKAPQHLNKIRGAIRYRNLSKYPEHRILQQLEDQHVTAIHQITKVNGVSMSTSTSIYPSNQGILNHWWLHDHSLGRPLRIKLLTLLNIGSPKFVLLQLLHAKSILGYHYSVYCLTIMRWYWQTKLKKFHGWHCSANNSSLSQVNQPRMSQCEYIYNRYPSTVKMSVTLLQIYADICFSMIV